MVFQLGFPWIPSFFRLERVFNGTELVIETDPFILAENMTSEDLQSLKSAAACACALLLKMASDLFAHTHEQLCQTIRGRVSLGGFGCP